MTNGLETVWKDLIHTESHFQWKRTGPSLDVNSM
jgi:hypothetical protein